MIHNKPEAYQTGILNSRFFHYYFITMRPYLLFISGITGMAGLSFAPDLPPLNIFILFIAFFLSYGFGQALTDCSQIDTDSISSPYRPLTQGLLNKKDVYWVSLAGLFSVGIVFIWHSLTNLLLTLCAILGLATYTFFKKRWWGGPFYNSWIVLVLFLIGYFSGTRESGTRWPIELTFLLSMTIVFFGYANFVLVGYFKDISADRATGYLTLPVVFGIKKSAYVSDIFAVLLLGATALLIFGKNGTLSVSFQNPTVFVFLVPGIILTIFAQYVAHKILSEETAHRAIVPIVYAYILILSAIIVSQKPTWSLFIFIFYAAFILIMKVRPQKEQI